MKPEDKVQKIDGSGPIMTLRYLAGNDEWCCEWSMKDKKGKHLSTKFSYYTEEQLKPIFKEEGK